MKAVYALALLFASVSAAPIPDGIATDNAEWHMCEPHAVPGYRPFCPRGNPGDNCVADTKCADGYKWTDPMVAPSGKFVCDEGVWKGSFTGCEVDVTTFAEARCPTPYRQTGYMMGPECAYGAPGGTECTAQCAPGFHGTPASTISCINGQWVGHLRGCSRPCMIPSYMCTPGKGIKYEYNLRALSPGHVINETTCMIHGREDLAVPGSSELMQLRFGCRRGYGANSNTNTIGDAICVNGALTPNYHDTATYPPYSCQAFAQPDLGCECGNRNEKRPTVRVRGGKFNFAASTVNGNSDLRCWQIGRSISCTCKCTVDANPIPAPVAYKPCPDPGPNYEVVSCSETDPSVCSVQCTGIPGTCGVVTGEYSCAPDGSAVTNTLGGCSACNCPTAYMQSGYVVTNCPADSMDGTSCSPACASGFTGSPVGPVTCTGGEWLGVFTGCMPADCAMGYMQHAYDSGTTCGSNQPHGTLCSPASICPTGYVGTPGGSVRCQFGQWVGLGFMGCMPAQGTCDVAEAGMPGYMSKGRGLVFYGFELVAADFECADGFTGTLAGTRTCDGMMWTGTLSDCNPVGCMETDATEMGMYTVPSATYAHDATITVTDCEGTWAVRQDPMVAPTGTKTCRFGQWVGMFSGCMLKPDASGCGAYLQDLTAYVTRGCEAGPNGQICEAVRCADGQKGMAMGWAQCQGGVWSSASAMSGCGAGAGASCPPYSVPGYAFGAMNDPQCPMTADAGTCTVGAGCAPGFTATTPAGSLNCQDGEWMPGTAFSGCTPKTCTGAPMPPPPSNYVLGVDCMAGAVHGAQCSATCASNYCGTPSGSVSCDAGSNTWVGTFSGCEPCPCKTPYMKAGYVAVAEPSGCAKGTASGTACSLQCAPGWGAGPVTGTVTCSMGMWTGTPGGCMPDPCSTSYMQTDYVITGCDAGTAHGTKCEATCAMGLCGRITGIVRCNAGVWEGAFFGCDACCQGGYTGTTMEYVSYGCDGDVPVGTVCQAACKYGYCGSVMGAPTCTAANMWTGGPFTGCSACPCTDAYMQEGYAVTGCGPMTADSTTCMAACASGYSGSVGGTVTCSLGRWEGKYSGCTPNPCPNAYTQANWVVSRCGANTPHGRYCTAVCAANSGMQGVGPVQCDGVTVGGYIGTFTAPSGMTCP